MACTRLRLVTLLVRLGADLGRICRQGQEGKRAGMGSIILGIHAVEPVGWRVSILWFKQYID